jgi:hypothetical protein
MSARRLSNQGAGGCRLTAKHSKQRKIRKIETIELNNNTRIKPDSLKFMLCHVAAVTCDTVVGELVSLTISS